MTPQTLPIIVLGALAIACGDDGSGGTDGAGSTGGSAGSSGAPTTTGPTTTTGATTTAGTGMATDGMTTGGTETGGQTANGPDLDGDGNADSVIGARYFNGLRGGIWIDYGDDGLLDSGLASADVMIEGSRDGQNLGMAATVCDFDDDGSHDLLVASLDGVHVYWGGTQLTDTSTEDLLIVNDGSLANLVGMYCRDMTGDGIPDLVSRGLPFAAWRVTIVPGSSGHRGISMLDPVADPAVVQLDGSDDTARPNIDVGDFNGDGAGDVIVGSPFNPGMVIDPPGAAFIFFGGAGLADGTEADADVVVTGTTPAEGLGTDVAAGDFNGDGIDDFAITTATQIQVFAGEPNLSALVPELPLGAGPKPLLARVTNVFDHSALPGTGGRIVADDDGTLWFFQDEDPNERMIALLDALDAAPRACQTTVPGRDVVGWTLGWDRDPLRSAQRMTIHGETDMVFQPAGPGGVGEADVVDANCIDLAPANGVFDILLSPTPSIVFQRFWEDAAAFSTIEPTFVVMDL